MFPVSFLALLRSSRILASRVSFIVFPGRASSCPARNCSTSFLTSSSAFLKLSSILCLTAGGISVSLIIFVKPLLMRYDKPNLKNFPMMSIALSSPYFLLMLLSIIPWPSPSEALSMTPESSLPFSITTFASLSSSPCLDFFFASLDFPV